MNKKQLILGCLIGISLLLTGCENKWSGVYHPEGKELGIDIDEVQYSPEFSSKEECIDWCREKNRNSGNPNANCECGKNCATDALGLRACDETIDVD